MFKTLIITELMISSIATELEKSTTKSYSSTRCYSTTGDKSAFIQNIELPTLEKYSECCNFWKTASDSLNSNQLTCLEQLDTKLLNEDGVSYKQVRNDRDFAKYLESVNFNTTRAVLATCIDFSLFSSKLDSSADQVGCLCTDKSSRFYLALDCYNSEGFSPSTFDGENPPGYESNSVTEVLGSTSILVVVVVSVALAMLFMVAYCCCQREKKIDLGIHESENLC